VLSAFLLRRGKGSLRRKAHLAHYDQFGEIDRTWCGRTDWNLVSNVPWGCSTCKHCLAAVARAAS
jgi:heterodisulfide reductase subunit C